MAIHPDIRHTVHSIPVIDTHEHLEEESARLARPLDFAVLFEQYAGHDVRSAGMPEDDWQKCLKPDTPLAEKWRLFDPYYHRTRNTAYCKAIEIAVRDLYGIEELNAQTVGSLSERLAERNRPGVLRWILQERCGIERTCVNALDVQFLRSQSTCDLFRQDLAVVAFLSWPIPFDAIEEHAAASVNTFAEYAKAIDTIFAKYGPQACAVKQQSAYWRPQCFDDVADADAANIFDRTRRDPEAVSLAERKAIQDWAFHRCIRNAIDHGLPIQIHTGYKAGCNYMDLCDIAPARLNNLFVQYPRAVFDLFHIGYPYEGEVLALAKHFENVYIDFCWAWIIDPVATRQFLKRCLTALPWNKVFGFGGDYLVAEPVYGHLAIARAQITRALCELVEEEYFTVPDAVTAAQRVLHDNAAAVFRL
ncbi:MAG: amidohydrolase family protein [Phycisphaerae bacterium]|nr:amidohydrolase family protein [Phycisphaerae bacterium]